MTTRDAEFNHPLLVQLYDVQRVWDGDDVFFLGLAAQFLTTQTPGARVLDIGCGTGRLALRLAAAGHHVTGLDPARASLDAARRKPGAGRVTWREGTAEALPADLRVGAFDLVLMTSHVAQFLTTDDQWAAALAGLRRALRPGGRLTFDSRDPAARGWLAWTPEASRETVTLPDGRAAECWTEVTGVDGELVSFIQHYVVGGEAAELQSHSTLRFRPEDALHQSLQQAGFGPVQVFGGWQGQPVGQGDGEFIVVAQAT